MMRNYYNSKIMGKSSAKAPRTGDIENNQGGVYRWFPSDTEKRFKFHMEQPLTRTQLIQNGWANKRTGEPTEILYELNSYGFRTIDLHDPSIPDNCAMFLGCSNMFGLGVFNKDTIPEKFRAMHPDLIPLNFGQPGGSLDACVRVAMYWVPILKPQVIFLLHPPGIRREIFMDQWYDSELGTKMGNDWVQFKLGQSLPGPIDYNSFERVFSQPEEESVNKAKNLYALEALANQWGCMLVEGDPRDIPGGKDVSARDCAHPGPKSWRWVAEFFSKAYHNKLEQRMQRDEE